MAAIGASSVLAQSKRVPSDSDITLIGKRTLGGVTIDSPIDHEIREGEEMARELEWRLRMIDDPVITEYVNRLTQLIVQNSDAHIPITVHLTLSEVPTAVFLPGGQLIVTSSLVLQTQNEAELAGILAHGIAHTALRTQSGHLSQLEAISPMKTAVDEPSGELFWFNSIFVVPGPNLRILGGAELDADYFGLQYTYAAGYDPNCFINYVDRISRALSKEILLKYRAWLPVAPMRVVAMRKEVAKIFPLRDTDVVSSSDYDAVRARLSQLKSPFPLLRKSDNDGPPRIRYATNPDQTAHIN